MTSEDRLPGRREDARREDPDSWPFRGGAGYQSIEYESNPWRRRMKAQILTSVFLGLGVLAACAETDPIGSQRLPWRIVANVDSVEMLVGDSVFVHAQTLDSTGAPTPNLPEIQTTSGPIEVTQINGAGTEDHPAVDLFLVVKAVGYGTARMVLATGSLIGEIRFVTLPAALAIDDHPAQIESLGSFQFTARALGTDGQPIPNVPIRWSTSRGYLTVDSLTGIAVAGVAGLESVTARTVNELESATAVEVIPTACPGRHRGCSSSTFRTGRSSGSTRFRESS